MLGRLISLSLRHNIPIFKIIQMMDEYATVGSLMFKIKKMLMSYITENNMKCPECNNDLNNDGGCLTCTACGWSKCG